MSLQHFGESVDKPEQGTSGGGLQKEAYALYLAESKRLFDSLQAELAQASSERQKEIEQKYDELFLRLEEKFAVVTSIAKKECTGETVSVSEEVDPHYHTIRYFLVGFIMESKQIEENLAEEESAAVASGATAEQLRELRRQYGEKLAMLDKSYAASYEKLKARLGITKPRSFAGLLISAERYGISYKKSSVPQDYSEI